MKAEVSTSEKYLREDFTVASLLNEFGQVVVMAELTESGTIVKIPLSFRDANRIAMLAGLVAKPEAPVI